MSWQYDERLQPVDPGTTYYQPDAVSSSAAEPRPTAAGFERSVDRNNEQPAGPPSSDRPTNGTPGAQGPQPFDILAWHKPYQECQRYFLDHGQYEEGSKILMAFINMKLPHQFTTNPMPNSWSTPTRAPSAGASNFTTTPSNPHPAPAGDPRSPQTAPTPPPISLHPYIRRLLATAFCKPPILSSLFGPTYVHGLSSIIEIERRNYLFAAKSVPWTEVKKMYDMGEGQICPFLMPLEDLLEEEAGAAEGAWGRWLEMGDWMVGERAPGRERGSYTPGEGGDARDGRGEDEKMADPEARRY